GFLRIRFGFGKAAGGSATEGDGALSAGGIASVSFCVRCFGGEGDSVGVPVSSCDRTCATQMVRPIPNTNGRTLLAITQATCVERLSSTCFPRTSQFVAPHLLLNLRTSKLQARGKVEAVAF